jgi:hypothetical protein
MRRLPPHLAPIGYSPRRYLPLSPAPVLGMGERLTDLRDLQQMFANGEQGGYWPADPAYAFEDSAGTIAASVNGVVGKRTDVALGKHAIQATTANKPYYVRTPITGQPWYNASAAAVEMTATFSGSLGSACTIATVTPEGVTIAENKIVGATYNICPPYGYNSDVLIINRALTPAEKALVTRVMQRSVPTLGSELVSNGGFDTNVSGWTAFAATIASVDNELAITNNTASYGFSTQLKVLTPGNHYYAKADARRGTINGCGIQFGTTETNGTFGSRSTTSLTTTTLTHIFSPASANVYCQLWTYNNSNGNTSYFDNFTLKAIL